ncbi:clarin-2-like [Diadema antillarum]|uniref:clarin-2-like n=1 Tax=Diadema antillarum TaxID=105358 RepID=UPI003A872EBA
MKTSVTVLYGVTLGFSICISCMLIASFCSPNWIEAQAIRNVTGAPDTIADPPNDRYSGLVTFGIIYGYKQFNYGFGARERLTYIVFVEYEDVYNTDLVVVTLVFMIPAVVFAVVATFFSYLNTTRVPTETLHGRPGLYLWNGIGLLACVLSLSVYAALYLTEIQYEALSVEDRQSTGGFYTDRSLLGYSYWLVVASAVLYVFNLILILMTQLVQDPPEWLQRRYRTADLEQPPATELKLGIIY